MKTTIWLVASLLLNAVFAAAFFLGRDSAPAVSVTSGPSAAKPAAPPQIDATIWPALESADLRTLADRLRASGFPPEVVRAIAAAQISERFAAQRRALRSDLGNRPFWKDGSAFDPKLMAAERELSKQQRALMRELFGDEADDDPQRSLFQNRAFTFLPPEKAGELRRILRDYDERRSDLFSTSPVYDREKIAALEKEQRAAIAQVLTPAEMLEYDLRTSNTAQRLRDELSAFQPSEEEFRAIFQLRQPFDERFDLSAGVAMQNLRARSESEKGLKEQIKAGLSPERAAEYDRATDYNYRRATQLIARLELPRENVDQLWAVQKDAEARRNEIYRAARTLTPDERTAQLAALHQDAVAKVTPLIGGPRNVDVYKQYGGQWLESLVPRTRPTLTLGSGSSAPAPAPPPTPKSRSRPKRASRRRSPKSD